MDKDTSKKVSTPAPDVEKVTPGTRATKSHSDLVESAPAFTANPGEHHVVELDPITGNEIPGSDFSIAPGRTFDKTYKNNPRYLLKKKQH